jgi:aminoglycoside phosphotransferase (APT) family kinase protein
LSIEPVGGGLTDTISAVTFRHGDPVILRYVSIPRWGEIGRRHVISEARGCQLMAGSGLPVPRLIASDPVGDQSGDYANLTTWLPGEVRLGPLGAKAIDALAAVAVVIHATPASSTAQPLPYEFWTPAELVVPTWSGRPKLWQRAIDIFQAGPPATRPGVVHRDFHPGNVLWQGDVISGIIDWAETSWGPADLDVAHSVTNFTVLHDIGRAAAFGRAYERHGGRLETSYEAAQFWQISDILGFLPDPGPQLAALIYTRPELTVDLVRSRLEQLLLLTLRSG